MKKKIIYSVIAFVGLLVLGLGAWWAYSYFMNNGDSSSQNQTKNNESTDEKKNDTEKVPISAEFENKIVYGTEANMNTDALKNDCSKRGGEFNECGTVCGPGAQVCTNVCAYTCELDTPSEMDLDWINYSNNELGVSFSYPAQMDLRNRPAEPGIYLVLEGPTQKPNTEFYDGISISFASRSYDTPDLLTHIEREIDELESVAQITQDLTPTVFAGKQSYTYTSISVGTISHIIVPREDKTYLEISYIVVDPTSQGYQQILDKILSSVELR